MLTEKMQERRERTRSGYYHQWRTGNIDFNAIAGATAGLSDCFAQAKALARRLDAEKAVIIRGERLQFTRTIGCRIPQVRDGYILENISPDYEMILQEGIAGRLRVIEKHLETGKCSSAEKDFLAAARDSLQYTLDFAEKYAAAAVEAGEDEIAANFRTVPQHPAQNLCQALQCIYFISAVLRISGAAHIGFGRMDQYLLPYFRRDLEEGRESAESAKELLTEFFICLNRDTDLFDGMQAGDNGQSLMLGGCSRDGLSADNELTILLMDIAADIAMIEPKINLRMNSKTSDEVLEAAARLAGKGLGFPQYNNDDVVIPGLVAFGYDEEDARDYSVAACWEFVVPGGRDIPNAFAMNLPLAADRAIRSTLAAGGEFTDIIEQMKKEMAKLLQLELEKWNTKMLPNPLFSAFCKGALEEKQDRNVSGGKYRYKGCHGCGSSTAADSLAAVERLVFEEKAVKPEILLQALENNFEGFEDIRVKLQECPDKVGCGSKRADGMLKKVFDTFAQVLHEASNDGLKIRAGSGSAMYYVIMTTEEGARRLHATSDGRKDGEYISSSLAAAPGVKAHGILSVLDSFSVIDYKKICNGGPLTVELAPEYFRSRKAVAKLITFLRAFVRSGCQQLQLNILDADVLREARKHPERYRDLVVRVWGWSGYFVELAEPYQEQIINRQAFGA